SHRALSEHKTLSISWSHYPTRSALLNADELGLDFDGMCNVIIGLSESDFYKSMTTYSDHTIWQDVYRPRLVTGQVYLKITVIHDVLIVSFKEK
ncbi:type II toxin-antitoxin system MqsR family toxin, partial [Escherichia coli]|uniref:type II toxin-antitoxin system MqsR family toxin n=1 Tax=Escherichia coli TaxID=562 RepID=UPI0039BFA2D8